MKWAYAVIVGALVLAALLCVGIFIMAPDEARLEIGVELAKAAIGLFPVVFFGLVVAEIVRRRDERRTKREKELDEERAQAEKLRDQEQAARDKRREARRAFRDRSIAAYNQSKSVRRYLRGAGFGPGMGSHISPEMLETLDQQMRRLSDTQLLLDQLLREVETSGAEFTDLGAVSTSLGGIVKSLNAVVQDWEHLRLDLGERPDAASLAKWKHFVDFVADADKKVLPDNPTKAFLVFERVVLSELAAS